MRLLTFFILGLLAIVVGIFVYWDSLGLFGALSCLLAYAALAEVFFRVYYKFRHGHSYIIVPRDFSRMYIEAHPYLPYTYKKNFAQEGVSVPAPYPLHSGKFQFPPMSFNNFRFANGPDGGRDIVVPKPAGVRRIVCLGASTTGNYIEEDGIVYSYPMELEKVLQEQLGSEQIQVENCGAGGRTSAEILVDFLLNIVDTEPDVVVVYHAYNDVGPSLTPEFRSDYSHARRSFGEKVHLYRWASFFPNLPSALYSHMVTSLFVGSVRDTLLGAVSKGSPDLSSEFNGLDTYQRNIEHIIDVCKARNIDVVCSSFCFHNYGSTNDSELHRKYFEGVMAENKAMKSVARSKSVYFVDAASAMPDDDECFVDTIHFTPLGMKTLAEALSEPVVTALKKRLNN